MKKILSIILVLLFITTILYAKTYREDFESKKSIKEFFGMKDPGNYFVLRSNYLENNCVLFGYQDGKRYTIKWVQFKKKGIIQNKKWHTLKVVVNRSIVKSYFNKMKLMEIDFSKGITGKRRKFRARFFLSKGKVGLWSKADSKTYFDDFTVKVK